MKVRAGTGWQTLLADLSIILFMITAATLSRADDRPVHTAAFAPPSPSPRAAPLAIYRAGSGAPALGDWLAGQSLDARQQLTILAQYRPGGQQAALDQAITLMHQVGAAGARTRLVVEPGAGGVTAALAFDDPTVAQDLHKLAVR